MNCPSCGAPGQTGRFCLRCRTRLASGPPGAGAAAVAVATPVTRSSGAERPPVPILVARLSTLAALQGAFCLISALPVLAGAPMLTAIVFVPMALLLFATAFGLSTLKPWGRMLQMAVAVLSLLGIPVGTALGIALLVYFNKPEVKAAFAGDDITPAEVRMARTAADLWKPLAIVIGVGNIFVVLALIGVAVAIVLPRLL